LLQDTALKSFSVGGLGQQSHANEQSQGIAEGNRTPSTDTIDEQTGQRRPELQRHPVGMVLMVYRDNLAAVRCALRDIRNVCRKKVEAFAAALNA
jgi:hypothetical protein